MALTCTAETRQRYYHREAGHRALNSGTNLSQPTCPVRVIFRRHTASVLHHLVEVHTSAVVRLHAQARDDHTERHGRQSLRSQKVNQLQWPRASNRLPAYACRDAVSIEPNKSICPDDRAGRFTIVPK